MPCAGKKIRLKRVTWTKGMGLPTYETQDGKWTIWQEDTSVADVGKARWFLNSNQEGESETYEASGFRTKADAIDYLREILAVAEHERRQ
jgi:hypothetical protein